MKSLSSNGLRSFHAGSQKDAECINATLHGRDFGPLALGRRRAMVWKGGASLGHGGYSSAPATRRSATRGLASLAIPGLKRPGYHRNVAPRRAGALRVVADAPAIRLPAAEQVVFDAPAG